MNKRIIIVGAGASGVAAATKLVSNGFKQVTILEGGNRIGGRINTIPFGANVVDMGAQCCHGENGNVVYQMAKDKNVLAHSNEEDFSTTFVRSNGEEIPSELTKKLLSLMESIYNSSINRDKKSSHHGSYGNYFAKKYKEALGTEEYKEVSAEVARELHDLFHKMTNLRLGTTWYDTSGDVHGRENCDGDFSMNWKDKGYVTVFNLLQNKISGGKTSQPVIDVNPLIEFNKEVWKIAYNQPDGTIKIECKDGSSYSGDHVICTVSLGVLKEHHLNMFEPLLPLWKIDSIEGMMIGALDKIYLEFDKPFWNEDWNGFSLLWKLEQLKEVQADPVNGDWLDGLFSFYRFNPLQPNVICGWIVGKRAQKMELKSDADVKAGAERVLRMFLKQWNIPDAKTMVRSKWYSNPLFRGAGACYTLKAEALGANCQKLAQSIDDSSGKPVVQFAGEATNTKYYSSVHGAVESGWREADRLINLYTS
ncbi:spermine oxidase-like [Sitodiplosis mosellana]|uniref:spermine oxidase-like n=1 Tax=Sitodiplosis mosellana TaxID=263140 RepID=UPI0024438A34|nr:spermine oxidase-like [Sitodiplosis mosellana]